MASAPWSPLYFWVLFFLILLQHHSLKPVHCWAKSFKLCPIGQWFSTLARHQNHLERLILFSIISRPIHVAVVQFSSVAQSCPTFCNPMNNSTPGLPVYHQLPEFTQIHVHRVSDAIQPSHPRSSPSPPAPNPSQHQSLFQWVNSSHEVAKVLEFQL